jgi:excisionase family DNA binding protein
MLSHGFNIEALLDELADRVVTKLRPELARGLTGTAVRPRLLTVDQAAVYLGRSREAIEHMIASGKLPTVRPDRRVFLDLEDLGRWISENKTIGV